MPHHNTAVRSQGTYIYIKKKHRLRGIRSTRLCGLHQEYIYTIIGMRLPHAQLLHTPIVAGGLWTASVLPLINSFGLWPGAFGRI